MLIAAGGGKAERSFFRPPDVLEPVIEMDRSHATSRFGSIV